MPKKKKQLEEKTSRKASERFKVLAKIPLSIPSTPYGAIRKTRKNRRDNIKELGDQLASMHFFHFYLEYYLFLAIAKAYKNAHERLQRTIKTDIETLQRFLVYNEVVTPTIRSCASEFAAFISELQAAVYSGAARTLRCILETAVQACGFQTESNRPTSKILMKEYFLIAEEPDKRKKLQQLLMQYNAMASFIERYRIYEQTKRIAPSFKESVNRLNSREIFRESPQIVDDSKRVYETLSDYVHPSSAKIQRHIEGKESPSPQFSSDDFDTIFQLALETFDIIQFLCIKSMSHFLGFRNAKAFLRNLAQTVTFDQAVIPQFLNLPHTKRIASGIQWKLSEKAEKATAKK